jgi:hypothetical protein
MAIKLLTNKLPKKLAHKLKLKTSRWANIDITDSSPLDRERK